MPDTTPDVSTPAANVNAGANGAAKAREVARRRASLRRWLRRGLFALVLVALAAMFVLALQPQPVPVDLVSVDRGAVEVVVDEPGRARVIDRYVVSAPLSGNVARVELHPSDTVEAGAIVARIVPLAPPLLDARTRSEAETRLSETRARREQARFSITHARELLAFAESEVARQRQLASSGAIAPRELERAEMETRTRRNEITSLEFGLRVAEHEVRLAEATLGRLAGRSTPTPDSIDVTSPVAGLVLRVVRESAGVIQAGEPILEIGDAAALEIVTDVLTSDAVRIAPGARARIDDWGGEPLEGRVRLVEPSATTRVSALGVEEQRVNVILALESPRDAWRALGDGYRVETHITVERRDDVVRVPASALFRTGDGWSAYVLDGALVRLRSVEVGLRSRDLVEVRSGLDEGDRVVAYPGERVVDGAEVAARP